MNYELEQYLKLISEAETLEEAKSIAERGLDNYYAEMDRMFNEMVVDYLDKRNYEQG